MNAGSASRFQIGGNRNQSIRPARITSETRKSTSETSTDPEGTMIRGKYTFEIMSRFVTTLCPDAERALEKNCQGSRAAKTMIA